MMKNKLFIAAFAAFALASCANDEVISTQTNDNDGIRFRSAVTNSRGSVVKVANLDETGFWVKAINHTKNENQWRHANNGVYKFVKGVDGSFQADTTAEGFDDFDVRWPLDSIVDFYATNINPEKFTLLSPTDNANAKYNSFQPEKTIKDQVDFVYASNQGNRVNFPNSVPLQFKHALAQIEIQAKNASDKYDVKVKGYRLAYLHENGTFTYGEVQTINSPTVSGSDKVVPNPGVWSNLSNSHVNYSSAFWGGDGYTEGTYEGYSDNVDSHYYLLKAEPQTISGANGEGFAMVLPQKVDYYRPETKVGAYLALLVQIDYKEDGKALYPATNKTTGKRIAYEGLPKCYGYVATPVPLQWEQGKKYTYVLDFTNAAGYVDPEKPDVVDPDDPDKPGKEEDDPYKKEDEVLGHAITFTVSVTDWDTTASNTKDVPM
jgi:hypothetical protein